MTRCASSTIGIQCHLSKVVHGMRNAEHHAVADRWGRTAFELEVGVLVVQGRDAPARVGSLDARRAQRREADRHRQPHVEADVAPARGEDRQARFGHALHAGPQLQRGPQAFAAAAALDHRLHQPLVVAVVVRDVAARAQQRTHRALQLQPHARGHEIEDARAAGRHDHLVGVEQLLGVARLRHRGHALHQRAGVGVVARAVAGGAQAFITLDADQRHRGARVQRARQRERVVVRAHAGAAAGDADLEQHLERCRATLRRQPGFDAIELRQRIDQEHHTQVRVLRTQRLQCRQLDRLHHLVGDERAPRAGRHADPQLEHVGEGDAPGAGVELAPEQLRRHRRLAVRREVDALARARNACIHCTLCSSASRSSTASGSGRSPASTFQLRDAMSPTATGAASGGKPFSHGPSRALGSSTCARRSSAEQPLEPGDEARPARREGAAATAGAAP